MSSKDLLFIYNFRLFQCVKERPRTLLTQTKTLLKPKLKTAENDETITKEMIVISRFLEYHQKNLLTAPVAESYLHLKWLRIKKFFIFNIIIYTLYVLSLSSLIFWTSYVRTEKQGNHSFEMRDEVCKAMQCHRSHKNFPNEIDEQWRSVWLLLYILSSLSTLSFATRELVQVFSNPAKYITSKENWLELLAIVSSLTYLVILVAMPFNSHPCCQTPEPVFGAGTVFLAWIEMSLLIGRFPSIGIYTYMSTQVVKQTIRFFSVYLTTLIAFALCFSILLPRSGIFENPLTSFIKVLAMMIGELDFTVYFTWDAVKSEGTFYSNVFTQIIFIMLLILISLIISNLVIGLTVNNTRELFKIAGIYRLGKTLRQIQDTEAIIINGTFFNTFKRFLPAKLFEDTELLPALYQAHNSSEAVLICVKPLNYNDDVSLSAANQVFRVLKYDGEKEKEGKATSMSLPKWVIDNTFNALRQKTKLLAELGQDLDRFCTRMERSGLSSLQSEALRSVGRQPKSSRKLSRYLKI